MPKKTNENDEQAERMNQLVREKAKELEKEFTGYIDVKMANDSYRQFFTDWPNLAKHVLASELRARIEELNECSYAVEQWKDDHLEHKLKQLNSQLEELKEKV